MATNSTQRHFQKIDFLRGIAILAVVQAHFIWYYSPDYAGVVAADGGHPLHRVILLNTIPLTVGWCGVTIFILVSGFLLHLGTLKDPAGFTLRGFYSRRFWRVYPPYLLVLLGFSLFLEKGLFTSRGGWITFLLHCFSLQNLFTSTFFSVNPTFWCLAAEVQLYLLYAVLLAGRRRWGIKPVVLLTFLLSIVWQVIGMRVGSLATSLPWTNAAVSLWVIWAMGAMLAEAFFNGQRLWAFLSARDRIFALAALLLACCVTPVNALLQYAAGIICVLLMDWFLHAGRVTLQRRPARMLITIGLFSFSLFLIHQPLIGTLADLFNGLLPRYPGCRLVGGLVALMVIFLLSYCLYRWVELPSMRMGSRLRAARRA